MAILHVRNVPDDLYERIRELADEESRSLTAEVVHLLEQGLQAHERRRQAAAIVERIRANKRTMSGSARWRDAARLLREDRSR